jgi:DsbC/DsbD-like thiol-disulfide interchange protein
LQDRARLQQAILLLLLLLVLLLLCSSCCIPRQQMLSVMTVLQAASVADADRSYGCWALLRCLFVTV